MTEVLTTNTGDQIEVNVLIKIKLPAYEKNILKKEEVKIL